MKVVLLKREFDEEVDIETLLLSNTSLDQFGGEGGIDEANRVVKKIIEAIPEKYRSKSTETLELMISLYRELALGWEHEANELRAHVDSLRNVNTYEKMMEENSGS